MTVIYRLTAAAYGARFSDQIAIVSKPLVAVLAFDASPELIGILVACQSLVRFIGSVLFGILVDRFQLKHLAATSALISLTGFLGASLSIVLESTLGFGTMATLAGFGVVLFGLTALSIVPRAVDTASLGRANAAMEIPRAFCSFLYLIRSAC